MVDFYGKCIGIYIPYMDPMGLGQVNNLLMWGFYIIHVYPKYQLGHPSGEQKLVYFFQYGARGIKHVQTALDVLGSFFPCFLTRPL